jgi:hypothetical protein
MRHATLAVVAFVVALTMLPARAGAQDWSQPWADPEDRPARVDVSASAGLLLPTRWSSLVLLGSVAPVSGVLEQVLTRDLRVEPDAEFNVATTYWRSRYGVRVQGGFSRSSLHIGSTPVAGTSTVGDSTSVGVDTWLYDVRAAIGFLDYEPSRHVWPYGFLGIGGVTYRLKTPVAPPLSFVSRPPALADGRGNSVVIADGTRQLLISVDELSTETEPAFTLGLGTDFRVPLGPAGVGLRVEVADQISPSPVGIRIRDVGAFGPLASDVAVPFRAVHQLTATAGLVLQIGR